MRKLSASELVTRHVPALSTKGTAITATFADPAVSQAFFDALLMARHDGYVQRAAAAVPKFGESIPQGATRMIHSIDLKEGPEPGRAVLELVDGDGRAHRFFVYADDLNRLATIRLEAQREGGFVPTFSHAAPEAAPDVRGLEDCAPADDTEPANLDAERKDDLLELAHIHTRLDRADDRIRRQQRQINTIMATYVERAHLPTGRFPSYCCQRCGEQIGWVGRAFQAVGLRLHTCRFPRADGADLATAEAVRSKVEAA